MSSFEPTSPTMPCAPSGDGRALHRRWRCGRRRRRRRRARRAARTSARPRPDVPPVTATRRPVKIVFAGHRCGSFIIRRLVATSSSELEVKRKMCFKLFRMEAVLTISEISRRSGVASSALRFYEERGLIASERAGSGHRRYPRSVLRRIAFIVFAQKIGLTPGGDRRGARKAAGRPRADARRLGAALGRAWKGASMSASPSCERLREGAHRMHRLRLPVDRPLQARQPGRRRGAQRAGAALLDAVAFRRRPRPHRVRSLEPTRRTPSSPLRVTAPRGCRAAALIQP